MLLIPYTHTNRGTGKFFLLPVLRQNGCRQHFPSLPRITESVNSSLVTPSHLSLERRRGWESKACVGMRYWTHIANQQATLARRAAPSNVRKVSEKVELVPCIPPLCMSDLHSGYFNAPDGWCFSFTNCSSLKKYSK